MGPIFNWLKRHMGNPQIVILFGVILGVLIVLIGFGSMLMPVLAGGVIAYLLEGPVKRLQRIGLPRIMAVILVFILFLAVLALLVLGIIPKLSQQISDFVERIPEYMIQIRTGLEILPERYPEFISHEQVAYLVSELTLQINESARQLALRSLSGLVNFIGAVVYIFLVPVLIFFFMKDKDKIAAWVHQFLPAERTLVDRIGRDVDLQMANYIRGKTLEMVIVGVAAYIMLYLFGLNYSILLATLVGMSVFIPVVGAIVMTVPVVLVGYLKFSFTPELMWLTLAYIVLQQLDGNVLVPILFSEVNKLHPVAIISAVLVFGGMWGFWGVFFAIPLATLVQAIIRAWPGVQNMESQPSREQSATDNE
ncbi:MAG: AI-2E family transporter [Desulfobacterales bacterium]|nr:AI-2E family transporter [Desulfobacterales bacterium]